MPIALFDLRLQLSFQLKFCCTMGPRSRCDCTGVSLALHKCASRFPLMLRVCDFFVFGNHICIKPGLDVIGRLVHRYLFVTITLKSSAYPKLSLSDIHSGRLLIDSRKRRGPRIDPWGTPLVKFLRVDFAPLICTYYLRWLKYDFRSPKMFPPIPRDLNLLISTLCGTVSNALAKSR